MNVLIAEGERRRRRLLLPTRRPWRESSFHDTSDVHWCTIDTDAAAIVAAAILGADNGRILLSTICREKKASEFLISDMYLCTLTLCHYILDLSRTSENQNEPRFLFMNYFK